MGLRGKARQQGGPARRLRDASNDVGVLNQSELELVAVLFQLFIGHYSWPIVGNRRGPDKYVGTLCKCQRRFTHLLG